MLEVLCGDRSEEVWSGEAGQEASGGELTAAVWRRWGLGVSCATMDCFFYKTDAEAVGGKSLGMALNDCKFILVNDDLTFA